MNETGSNQSNSFVERLSIIEDLLLSVNGAEENVIVDALCLSGIRLSCMLTRLGTALAEDINQNGELQFIQTGSTISGHVLINSTLDIFVEYKCQARNQSHNNLLTEILRKLRYGRNFNGIEMNNNYVPFVKCIHRCTGKAIKIFTGTKPSINRSKFVAKLMRVDPRIRPLIILLKTWAINVGILKTGKLSTYGFIWLILFYLQRTTSTPILPAFHHFIEYEIIDSEVRFNNNYQHRIVNSSNIANLIVEFFVFCTNISFDSTIFATNAFGEQIATGPGNFIDFLNNIDEYQIEHIGFDKVYIRNGMNLSRIYDRTNLHSFFNYFKYQAEFGINVMMNCNFSKKLKYLLLLDYLQPQCYLNLNSIRININRNNISSQIIEKTMTTSQIHVIAFGVENKFDYIDIRRKRGLPGHVTTALIENFLRHIFKIQIDNVDSYHSPVLQDGLDTVHYYRFPIKSRIDLWSKRVITSKNKKNNSYFDYQRNITETLIARRECDSEFSVNLSCSLNVLIRSRSKILVAQLVNHAPGWRNNQNFKIFSSKLMHGIEKAFNEFCAN